MKKNTKLTPQILKQIISEEKEAIANKQRQEDELRKGVKNLKKLKKKQLIILAEALRIHEASKKLKKLLAKKTKE